MRASDILRGQNGLPRCTEVLPLSVTASGMATHVFWVEHTGSSTCHSDRYVQHSTVFQPVDPASKRAR